ncbi:uncharacterized protein PGTG_10909 [Puccinia graminis f. sp. tritici CRL 75-36-700-3]|uniref:Uncharacterized protein n=1 Tax=Puccinia graminis f. sp. tritici (strain CRL 75-36-700-3 / race SCCL) TaxID=418459 RepID=E3KKC5_PUCGT|nr:uncharacterized protein PGTG_10909 [Puccinia graminis f. sp. tritici CRL 75-36-700-3]EFP84750.1 hypothetical protein PGTG_10909 [Puccinia graminis f. sp. tritici CRL 75-36-700-3]
MGKAKEKFRRGETFLEALRKVLERCWRSCGEQVLVYWLNFRLKTAGTGPKQGVHPDCAFLVFNDLDDIPCLTPEIAEALKDLLATVALEQFPPCANLAAYHAKQVTIQPKDIQLTQQLRGKHS